MIIVIDGPAGSGKSSTARAVAQRLGFRYLDSGALYRALTYAALRAGWDPADWPHLQPEQLDSLQVHGTPSDDGFRLFAGATDITAELRSADVNAQVSHLARIPAVRTWLLDRQRELARTSDLVADGRDLATVVFPDADLKIFLSADPAIRAQRRLAEQGNTDPSEREIQDETVRLTERDRIDSTREVAPLRQAEDAIPVDTSELSFEEQVEKIVKLAKERTQRRA
jgi:cytidylate kinase